MKLGSTMRINKRYLLIQGKKEDIEQAILDYIGILGWAKASPEFVDFGKERVLSVDRKEIDNVRAAFAAYGKGIKVLRVSGTLKGLEK